MTHDLDDHFEVTDEEFEEIDNKVSKMVTRTLVVVKDASEFIYEFHEKRNLDIHETYVKAGFDYGGECLKLKVTTDRYPVRIICLRSTGLG